MYGGGVRLEEGSVGSHAAIVARALAIPLVIHAERITNEALNGDRILVDGDQGVVHLRPDDSVNSAFRDKMAMQAKAQERYASIRDIDCVSACGTRIGLHMNAGLMADLPSLHGSGAEGVGLFRTELQFLIRNKMPRRTELVQLYSRVLDAAGIKGLKELREEVLRSFKRRAGQFPDGDWRFCWSMRSGPKRCRFFRSIPTHQ